MSSGCLPMPLLPMSDCPVWLRSSLRSLRMLNLQFGRRNNLSTSNPTWPPTQASELPSWLRFRPCLCLCSPLDLSPNGNASASAYSRPTRSAAQDTVYAPYLGKPQITTSYTPSATVIANGTGLYSHSTVTTISVVTLERTSSTWSVAFFHRGQTRFSPDKIERVVSLAVITIRLSFQAE